jgi:hypothetical protein
MNLPPVVFVFVAAAAVCIWNLARGAITGCMHFGLAGIGSVNVERSSDPRGFWIYGLANVGTVAVAAVGLFRTIHPQ